MEWNIDIIAGGFERFEEACCNLGECSQPGDGVEWTSRQQRRWRIVAQDG